MLSRIYRPKTFAEVVGQEHVVQTLKGALTTNRVGHAYLFTGPQGSGKTTMARLLAKALNCEHRRADGDCDDTCSTCQAINTGRSLDLIEIDAASNRGIDEIRSLKESAGTAASAGRYKVFIIDEVHMLTAHAFNALLKVLEEPPGHIVFILATTEPHKVLATVLSRVQRFDFRKLTALEIAGKLTSIAKKEKIVIEPEAVKAIAASSDGALRDAEVALAKVSAFHQPGEKIDVEGVYRILGLIPSDYHPELLKCLISADQASALALIQKMSQTGINPDHFTREFLDYLRRVLIHSINPAILASTGNEFSDDEIKVLSAHQNNLTSDWLTRVLVRFMDAREVIRYAPIAQLPLELAVIDLTKKMP